MAIPGQTFSIIDPGLPVAVEAVNAPLIMGCCESGTVNTVYAFSRPSDVVATLGQGPLSETVCTYLSLAGGPAYVVRLTGGTAGTAGTLTRTSGGGAGTATLSGTPLDGYEIQLQFTKAGALGTAEFIYSLDDGYTWTEAILTPSGGTFVVPSTGLTITFASTFALGDFFEADCTAPHFSTTNLASGINAVLALNIEFAFVVLAGEAATSSAGAAVAVAAASHAATFFTGFRFVRVITAAGRSVAATAITDYANVTSTRLMVTYGRCDVASKKPIAGWGFPNRSVADVVAARAGQAVISADLARVAAGALEGVLAISHDEALTELMDAKKFTTLRTIQGRQGFYITNGRLMSPTGSDYRYWQHGRCMDVACDTAYKAQLPYLGDDTRTNTDGTIDERDARRYEGPVRSSLQAALLDPNAANGTRGHVSAVNYQVDRTNNILTSETLQTTVSIRPRGYIKHISTQLGFAVNVGG